MKVFVFDLLAYGEQLDHLKVANELPYPLPARHFKSEVAVRNLCRASGGVGGSRPARL